LKEFYRLSTEQVCRELSVDPQKGLSSEEAKKRLQQYGPNELAEKKKRSIFQMFFSQFTDFLIIILLVAAGISIVVGEAVDAILIMIIVVLNATLSTIQEAKAKSLYNS